MNASSPDVGFLQQLFFQQNYLDGKYAEALDRLGAILRYLGSTLSLSVLAGVLLCIAIVLIYRPKLTRGALWVPAFGLFGGTPTLYMRTRPASVCGIFATARRLHRATGWSKERRTAKVRSQ